MEAKAQVSKEWIKRYSGPGRVEDIGTAIMVDSARNVYVTGKSFDQLTGFDYTTVKYDSTGTKIWGVRHF